MEPLLKDYLHLYIGCEVAHGNSVAFLTGMNTELGNYTVSTVVGTHYKEGIPIGHIKLILRPLSDMKDGEAIDLLKIQCHNAGDTIAVRYKDGSGVKWKYKTPILNKAEMRPMNPIPPFNN